MAISKALTVSLMQLAVPPAFYPMWLLPSTCGLSHVAIALACGLSHVAVTIYLWFVPFVVCLRSSKSSLSRADIFHAVLFCIVFHILSNAWPLTFN